MSSLSSFFQFLGGTDIMKFWSRRNPGFLFLSLCWDNIGISWSCCNNSSKHNCTTFSPLCMSKLFEGGNKSFSSAFSLSIAKLCLSFSCLSQHCVYFDVFFHSQEVLASVETVLVNMIKCLFSPQDGAEIEIPTVLCTPSSLWKEFKISFCKYPKILRLCITIQLIWKLTIFSFNKMLNFSIDRWRCVDWTNITLLKSFW